MGDLAEAPSAAAVRIPAAPAAGVADYLEILKPRVMSLVVFTGLVGLVLAPGHLHPVLAGVAVLCIAIGAGASGAINMWYERDIDGMMRRTADRPLPAGRMIPGEALGFGAVLGAVGQVRFRRLSVGRRSPEISAGVLSRSSRSSFSGPHRISGPSRCTGPATTPRPGCRCCRSSPGRAKPNAKCCSTPWCCGRSACCPGFSVARVCFTPRSRCCWASRSPVRRSVFGETKATEAPVRCSLFRCSIFS